MFRIYYSASLALLFSTAAFGAENFVTHATTPYPPACVSTADLGEVGTPSNTRITFLNQLVGLTAYPNTSETANVEMTIIRRGCKDPDRGVLMVTANLINGGESFFLPRFFAEIGGTRYPLRLTNEPNSFEQKQGGSLKSTGPEEYILDGVAESEIATTDRIISVDQYNGAFKLILQDGFDPSTEFELEVTAYTGFQVPRNFPLNGRLSGNWVVKDVPDQGFVIAFNEFINQDGVQNFIFFSWYTYNTDGSTLWLTAGAFHDIANDSVELDFELVTNGEFLGDKTADREVVGSATLTAENCNEMTLDFNLEQLGLGSDSVTLSRIFSLETAGYACRDQTARLDALND
jgi:hypothetical protein